MQKEKFDYFHQLGFNNAQLLTMFFRKVHKKYQTDVGSCYKLKYLCDCNTILYKIGIFLKKIV